MSAINVEVDQRGRIAQLENIIIGRKLYFNCTDCKSYICDVLANGFQSL